jgi:hypothetical protein
VGKPDPPDIKYIIHNGQVHGVYEINENYSAFSENLIDTSDITLYGDRMDAMYCKLVTALSGGKPLENYRSSKYFKYYVDRLKIEHPEYAL